MTTPPAPNQFTEIDQRHMQRAIHMAMRGQGFVEPNPMVGCVIGRGERLISEGWHQQFGGPHAEVNALLSVPESTDLSDATMYVTLEPCAHYGKTPPCVAAIVKSGIRRVVIAQVDPNTKVDGRGVQQLQAAGLDVQVGLFVDTAQQLNAPYEKRILTGRPWVIAKWAMTLDGRIATRIGDSKWISNRQSRAKVHLLRGRMDAIIVGRQTAAQDDPALTARPPGPRTAARIVVDSRARIRSDCQLVTTASQTPTIIVVGPDAPQKACDVLVDAGCQIIACPATDPNERLRQMLDALGQREMTNVLIEGGGELLGSAFDQELVDEAHVFISPKIIGGRNAVPAVGGEGLHMVEQAWQLGLPSLEILDADIYIHGRLR